MACIHDDLFTDDGFMSTNDVKLYVRPRTRILRLVELVIVYIQFLGNT